jgi:YVTN family beta-propeller protein
MRSGAGPFGPSGCAERFRHWIGWGRRTIPVAAGVALWMGGVAATGAAAGASHAWLSPAALAASVDGHTLYIACAAADQVVVFDLVDAKTVRTIALPGAPSGLALAPDSRRLYVTCAAPASRVCVVDPARGTVLARIPAGHTAMGPVVSGDGRTLYVCNRFNDDIAVIDLQAGKAVARIAVQREPVAAALTRDGRHLLVANHLHAGRADADDVAAAVSVIDVAARRVVKELRLPNGSGALNDLRVSPDGRYAVVTHILARFYLPTTQLDRGWMNTNAETIIDLDSLEVVNTVLLDNVDSGAANPWGVSWSADGQTLAVAHAGTHEVSVIDFPGLLAKLAKLPEAPDPAQSVDYGVASRVRSDVRNDLSFLVGLRHRVRLPRSDRGPRAIAVVGRRVYTANYFSDSLSAIDLDAPILKAISAPLGPSPRMNRVRKGEFYFNEAGICFQGWQSCATCHPGDARVDALNWDLLNDGIGTPKNNKSLLWAHRTPPAMSLGVRDNAQMAVRAGIRHILFTVQPEEVPLAIDDYLKSLRPVPSPQLVNGKLSPAARRGQRVFADRGVGCASCHPPGLFTDLEHYDVGTRGKFDQAGESYDTPTLVEAWRTAPYLHDGSAATLREIFSGRNPEDRHGKTSHLSPAQLDDLVAYLLSL